LIRLIALWLALAPLPTAIAYSETDLATLNKTGSCAGCDLTGADLYEADLFRANLLNADLREADLTAADLTLADLRSADLRGAILEEANLSGANLTNALLDQHALAGAVFDSERTRTTLGFKDLKLGMNAMEIAQYCSIESIDTKTDYLTNNLNSSISQLEGTCFDNADMPFVFKFSRGGYAYRSFFTSPASGVLNFLQVGLAPYTEENHRKFIDLLEKKYEPARSYSAADVAAFNKDRSLEGQSLDTIFANGQVTLSVVSRGTGLQLLLSYRAKANGRHYLDRKGGRAPVDLTQLPAVTTDLYKLVGNYSLKGIGAKGTSTNHGRIDTAFLEIDAFESELAGELAISGTGMSGRFRITRVEEVSSRRLIFELEPVEGSIPDGRPLRMSLEFAEDGDSFTGRWTNWFRLKHSKTRRPDDFVGVRSQSFWQTVMTHNRIDMYQAYLRLHPGGIYTAVARSRITELGGTLPAPSAPTVSSAIPTERSTPTTATTTPVDPLVGIWVRSLEAFSYDRCYLAVGQQNDGRLVGKSWGEHLLSGSNFFSQRDLTIQQDSETAYFWEADKPKHNPEAYVPPDKSGKITRREADLKQFKTNARICVKLPSGSKYSTFRMLTLEEALALELPPELLAGFPSPFVTEGSQVASVSEAPAATPATPSAATVTTAPVDPLVGIWTQTSRRYGNCYFIVGQRADGALAAVSFQNILKRNIIGNDAPIEWGLTDTGIGILARTISIKPAPKGAYSWESAENFQTLGLPTFLANPPKKGRFFMSKDKDGNPRVTSNKKLCVEEPASPPTGTFRKLSLDDAIALELPSIAQKDFPSPFQEGTQWSGDLATEVTGATQTTNAAEDASDADRR